jgi:hypothetical protein
LLAPRANQFPQTGSATYSGPSASEVADRCIHVASEYVFVGTFSENALRQQYADLLGHHYFSSVFVLRGTGIQSNRPGEEIHLAYTHPCELRMTPAVREPNLEK